MPFILQTTPYIADPIKLNHNVAKQSYRIDEVNRYLSKAFDYLHYSKLKYDKNELDVGSNVVLELLLSK